MPDGHDPDLSDAVVKQIDDPVRADAKGPQASQSSPKGMPGLGLTLQQPKRLADSVGHGPIELEDLTTGPTREDDSGHLPSASSGREFSSKLGQRHRLAALDLSKPFFDRAERLGIREDLGGLLQSVVLVDRDEHGRGPTPPGHDDVFTEISDAIDEMGKLATQLPHRNRFGHTRSVPY